MLDPNNPDDIISIEKSRNIIKEILDFGISENEKIKIIELLCLELENIEVMKKIINIIKNNQVNNTKQKKELIL